MGRFASLSRQASVSNCCLPASGPLPACALLGTLPLMGLFGFFLRGHDHHHVAPVQIRLALDAPEVVEVGSEAPEESLSEFRMLDLTSAEHYGDLHLVAAAQEALDVAALGVEVVVADLGPELYLPHVDVDLLFAGGLAGLLLLVLVLAVVHEASHRRIRVRGDLNEVKVHPLGCVHRLADVLYPQLLAVGRDQPHGTCPDLTVDPRLFFSRYCEPLLSKTKFRGQQPARP